MRTFFPDRIRTDMLDYVINLLDDAPNFAVLLCRIEQGKGSWAEVEKLIG